jgi:hypothetical protein
LVPAARDASELPVCRRSWKCNPGAPIAATTVDQLTILLKLARRIGRPLTPANTSAVGSAAT